MPRIKDGTYVINLIDKKIKEDIGFHYLSTEIQLYTLIFLGLNIFLKKYYAKSKVNLLHTRYLQYKIMILVCVNFITFFLS